MAPQFSFALCTHGRKLLHSPLQIGKNHVPGRNCVLVRYFRNRNGKKTSLAPVAEIVADPVGFTRLVKPFVFTVSFCGLSFVGATIWQYENMRRHAASLRDQWQRSSFKQGNLRRKLNIWWNSQSDGHKVAFGIIAANVGVFLLWRIPALQSTMLHYFASNPASKTVCFPMVLSTFSHYSLLHLGANMCVLYSFSSSAVAMFGKEQFMALYLSAGCVSSFVSYLHKVSTRKLSPSLGASGALMAVLATICFQYPDAALTILILPFFTFPAGVAIKVVMGLDATGLLMGWKLFDHAAHLGGALCGILYLWYGQEYVWKQREPLMHWWHSVRSSRE